jgi:hypothetical protein
MRRIAPLSEKQLRMLDLVLERLLSTGQPTPGRALRMSTPLGEEKQTTDLLASLTPLYLTHVVHGIHDNFWMTPRGFLASSLGERAATIVEAMLEFFRIRFARDPAFERYTWDDLKTDGVATTDDDFKLVFSVIGVFGLGGGGSGGLGPPPNLSYAIPYDVEKMRPLRTAMDYLLHREAAVRASELELKALNEEHRRGEYLATSGEDDEEDGEEDAVAGPISDARILVFISHSARDVEHARALVECIEACLEVPDGTIRCTSVPGYRLEPGSDAHEALRMSLKHCAIVIGLLTENSLQSSYVIMELGAAWALRKTTCPLLAEGVDYAQLPGPLTATHATRINDPHDLTQLMETVAKETGLRHRNRSRGSAAVEKFVRGAASRGHR